jgi:Zn-dependent M28 family amino/carboxypeptidase
LEGSSEAIFIVGAHFDHHEEYGEGVVDNWSGASLLPSLFESLKSQALKHTFRFIGFAEEEKGLIGSKFYAKQLKPEDVDKVRVMIDLDSLGLGPTQIWLTHSDQGLAAALNGVANALKLPLGVANADQCCDEDSTPFRKLHIPTVMLHSITQGTLPILHSPNDNLARIHLSDYYDSYRLITAYLAYLDGRN